VPVPSFASFAELNAYLARRCEEELDRTVRGQSETKRQRLETDRAAMLGFPATSLRIAQGLPRQVQLAVTRAL
jgi:hypothetical protein